jgi:hypothetical protein
MIDAITETVIPFGAGIVAETALSYSKDRRGDYTTTPTEAIYGPIAVALASYALGVPPVEGFIGAAGFGIGVYAAKKILNAYQSNRAAQQNTANASSTTSTQTATTA